MENAIVRLAQARKMEAEWQAEVAEADVDLKASAEWQYREQRVQYLKAAQADVADAEAEARKQALAAYEETGDKAPHPAVKVKMYTALCYNLDKALDYAREHLPQALKLDKRTFEKAAKVLELDFVDIVQEPRAILARDLGEYLPAE